MQPLNASAIKQTVGVSPVSPWSQRRPVAAYANHARCVHAPPLPVVQVGGINCIGRVLTSSDLTGISCTPLRMEYTIRFALKRDGTMIAPPRMTYSSHGVPTATRDIYREAIDEALKRCIPLHFSAGMAGAVAGRPIAIRFVDDRTIDKRQDMK
jgi:hypothetical protein